MYLNRSVFVMPLQLKRPWSKYLGLTLSSTSFWNKHVENVAAKGNMTLCVARRNHREDCRGQITMSKIDEICQWAIPKQISIISMHISNLVKIHWDLLNLLSWKYNTDVLRADNSVKNVRNSPISNPKADVHNINAHRPTQFGENPLLFTKVIVQKWKFACRGHITLPKIDEIRPLTIPNQPSRVWWKSIDI